MNLPGSRAADKNDKIVGLVVWLTALIVYYLTKQCTVSFWDCGEFIACGSILGIPHPPGTPLYIIVARIFSVLPLDSDPAVRINLISVICSAFTALFAYLVVLRVTRKWLSVEGHSTGWLARAGAASGALLAAFGLTNWNNSVEAEVYGMAMMLVLAVLWLSLKGHETSSRTERIRLLLAVVFLSYMGIGVHMTVLLTFPIAAMLFMVKPDAQRTTWSALAALVAAVLYFIFAFSSEPGQISLSLPAAIVLLVFLFYTFSFDTIPRLHLYLTVGLAIVALPIILTAAADVLPALSTLAGLMEILAALVGIALLGYGAWAFYVWHGRRHTKKGAPEHKVIAITVGAAALMVALLNVPKGMGMFLLATVIAGALVLWWRRDDLDWAIVVAVAGPMLIVLGIYEYIYGTIASLILVPVVGLALKRPGWRAAMLVPVIAAVGFSVHAFIPIRSAQEPAINENDPGKSLDATIYFLERKQYGSVSMVERMFIRRADWSHQFGDHPRMGFWGFFHEQYGITGPWFVLPFLLGVFGVWELIRRAPPQGAVLLLLLLVSTVGLILYMNFADGTREHIPGVAGGHLEVRDRDYFFTPAFIFFGMALGLGATVAVRHIRNAVASSAGAARIATAIASLAFLLPVMTLAENYYRCDRSANYMPFDYAWNLLQSVEQDAILFTNGDNDTFPLWCLQETYGIRRDVRVVNLALANTDWYAKQIQTTMGLDMGWTDAHIDSISGFRVPDEQTMRSRGHRLSPRVYEYMVIPTQARDSLFQEYGPPYGSTFQRRDMIADKLIYNYLGKRPISFSVTTNRSSRQYLGHPLTNRLVLSGMDWEVSDQALGRRLDFDETMEFFTTPGKFQARGVADPDVYKGTTALRLTANWANGFMMLADSLRRAKDYDGAARIAERAHSLIPHSQDPVEFLATLYGDMGAVDKIDSLMVTAMTFDRQELLLQRGYALLTIGDTAVAQTTWHGILAEKPTHQKAFDYLLQSYYEAGDVEAIRGLVTEWLVHRPDDQRVQRLLEGLDRARAADEANQRP